MPAIAEEEEELEQPEEEDGGAPGSFPLVLGMDPSLPRTLIVAPRMPTADYDDAEEGEEEGEDEDEEGEEGEEGEAEQEEGAHPQLRPVATLLT